MGKQAEERVTHSKATTVQTRQHCYGRRWAKGMEERDPSTAHSEGTGGKIEGLPQISGKGWAL